MDIFEVFEIEWPSRNIITPPHGLFTNFAAAEAYLKDCITPIYDRYMVIIRTRALDHWPVSSTTFFSDNELTYYRQSDNAFVEIEQ